MDDKELLALVTRRIEDLCADLDAKEIELSEWATQTDRNGNPTVNAYYSLGEMEAVKGINIRLKGIRFRLKHRD